MTQTEKTEERGPSADNARAETQTVMDDIERPASACNDHKIVVDLKEARRFLQALDPTTPQWTFQTFDDIEDHTVSPPKKRKDKDLTSTPHGSIEYCSDKLIAYNKRGAGVFITVNQTDLCGRKKGNIKRVRALFIDLDGSPLEPVLDDPIIPPPHIIIETSPDRWHCYWLVNGLDKKDFEAAQKKLIARFNSDKVIHDLPRVMRLPGFWHQKGEPVQVKIQSIRTDVPPFLAAEFSLRLKQLPEPEPEPKGKGDGKGKPTSTGVRWQKINDAAMANFDAWVPALFPDAEQTSNGGYRMTSAALKRDLEEDLSFHSDGIYDFGIEEGRTPIAVVMEHGKKASATPSNGCVSASVSKYHCWS